MSIDEIRAVVALGESETLEFKETTGSRREAAETICGMLNHRGGLVLFGVTDQGKVVGQQMGESTITDVVQEIQRIEPPVFPSIDQTPAGNGREVLAVRVSPGNSAPYSYRGVPHLKVGNATIVMSRGQYNQMLLERMHAVDRWENQPADGWSVNDLDSAEIQRTVEESINRGRGEDPGTRNTERLLLGLGLIKNDVLLRAAVVLFGENRRIEAEMPQCTLRVARFRGTGKSEFLDNRQFHGNAFTLLSHAERFLMESLPIAGRVTAAQFQREDFPLYPPVALREALANAFCHRDYSSGGGTVSVGIYDDRLEITSPGPLPFGITEAQLFVPHESRPWNPIIARTFYRRGIIEQWGMGTLKIAELTQSAGLPRPEIRDSGLDVTVRFLPSRYIPPQRVAQDLTERQQAILALLNQAGRGLAFRQICEQLKPTHPASDKQVRTDLMELRTFNLVFSTGWGRSARWHFLVSEALSGH